MRTRPKSNLFKKLVTLNLIAQFTLQNRICQIGEPHIHRPLIPASRQQMTLNTEHQVLRHSYLAPRLRKSIRFLTLRAVMLPSELRRMWLLASINSAMRSRISLHKSGQNHLLQTLLPRRIARKEAHKKKQLSKLHTKQHTLLLEVVPVRRMLRLQHTALCMERAKVTRKVTSITVDAKTAGALWTELSMRLATWEFSKGLQRRRSLSHSFKLTRRWVMIPILSRQMIFCPRHLTRILTTIKRNKLKKQKSKKRRKQRVS